METARILVLEAGEDLSSDPRVTTPALFPTLLGSEADWNTFTEPQSGLCDRIIGVPHGRVVGGSSAINGQAFIAPSKFSIDAWEKLGNPGWNWDTLAPYFKKCHTLHTPPKGTAIHDQLHLDYINLDVSGKDGPIQASFPDDIEDPLPQAWHNTLKALGHEATGDPFCGDMLGCYTNAATIDPHTRQRSFASSAYLKPARNRSNLTLVTGAHVLKILFDNASPQVGATGVQYSHNGETKTVSAMDEVILSAGAFGSPKILELSGIGNESLLSSLNIPVIISNNNVGENLQDHPMAGLSFEVNDGVATIDNLLSQDPTAIKAAMERYATSQSGPLAVGGIYNHSFLPLQSDDFDRITDSLGLSAFSSLEAAQAEYYESFLTNSREATASLFAYAAQGDFGSGSGSSLMNSKFLPGAYYSIAVLLLQPLSRGSVHIQSASAFHPPKVDPRYLTNPLDVEIMTRHMTYINRIVSTEPLASVLKHNGRRNNAAPADLTDLEAMRDYVQKVTMSGWHPTSTCAMLPRDKGGVVNHRLIVHGTRNLRVVDANIFPITTRSNPLSTVYATAERAATLIEDDFKRRHKI